jgi:hypothetical protein
MSSEQEPRVERSSFLKLAFLALLAGTAVGLIGAAFRLTLRRADHFRDWSLAWTHGQPVLDFSWLLLALLSRRALQRGWFASFRRRQPAAESRTWSRSRRETGRVTRSALSR